MTNDIFSQFKKVKESVNLSTTEKSFHRGKILEFIGQVSPRSRYVTLSPYFSLFLRRHLVVASLVFVFILSSGVTLGAENSLPNELLYQVKTNFTEPVLFFLAPTSVQKTKLGIAFVNRRLEELSQVILLTEKPSKEERVAILAKFSSQVESAQAGILGLIQEEDIPSAIEAVNDLQAILSAHDLILKKINVAQSQKGNNLDELSVDLNKSIGATSGIANSLVEKVSSFKDQSKLDQVISRQEQKTTDSLEEIKEKIEDISQTEGALDQEDEFYVETEISKISGILETAQVKKEEGNKKEALVLYNQADQLLSTVDSLIQADKNLGVDLLGEADSEADKDGAGEEIPD